MSWRTDIAKNVRELRFVFCQTSQHSKGVRYVPTCASLFFTHNHAILIMIICL